MTVGHAVVAIICLVVCAAVFAAGVLRGEDVFDMLMTGITIAILASNNPYMVPLAAFFMAYLSKGCDLMATYAKVPAQLIDIIQGVIFLFFAAEQFLAKYRQKLVVKSAEEEIARLNLNKEG